MQIFTKESLVQKLTELAKMGWIKNGRFGNQGGIGNTLEDFLGIKENNLPIPNAAEWELKTQRIATSSLTTLFHMEPSPTAIKFVSQVLLPKYGWSHKGAGGIYNAEEKSFRQTISGIGPTDRGFSIRVNRKEHKILVSFDSVAVDAKHNKWLDDVSRLAGLDDLDPQPYWGFDDLKHKAGTKLLNCFYVQAEIKKENGEEYYHYRKALMLRKFDFEKFLQAIEHGNVLVDFDARSGHNHGTKFRLRQNHFPELYNEQLVVVDESPLNK